MAELGSELGFADTGAPLSHVVCMTYLMYKALRKLCHEPAALNWVSPAPAAAPDLRAGAGSQAAARKD